MNENRSEWVRIGAEENDAPWCREFDDRSGIQLVADADILHEAVLGLAYDELDAIPRVAAYKARIAELETENAILKAAVECWKTEQFVNQQSARIAELEAALANLADVCRGIVANGEIVEYIDLAMAERALAQPEAERAAVPEAAVCPGDYCDDGCDRCPGA